MARLETILEYAFAVIYTILNDNTGNKQQHFLGGSRRFGYFTKKSDYDIIIIDKHPGLLKILNQGFKEVRGNETNYHFSNHYRLMIGENHIDLIVVSERHFVALSEQHCIIENMLFENKKVVEFIKVLKCREKISGSKIYKVLMSLTI